MSDDAAVTLALMVADGGENAGPNAATVLAWEVRNLRVENERLKARVAMLESDLSLLDPNTPIEDVDSELEAAGIDVPAFLERTHALVRVCKENTALKAQLAALREVTNQREGCWRAVGDGAYARPFGTIRQCLDCGALVGGGPTRCVRCVRESERSNEPRPAKLRKPRVRKTRVQ